MPSPKKIYRLTRWLSHLRLVFYWRHGMARFAPFDKWYWHFGKWYWHHYSFRDSGLHWSLGIGPFNIHRDPDWLGEKD